MNDQIAEDSDHMIHFKGERFLRPHHDVMPIKMSANSNQPQTFATLHNTLLPKLLSWRLLPYQYHETHRH